MILAVRNSIHNFHDSLLVARRDKVIILLGLIPIMAGIILYALLGTWLFTDVWAYGNSWTNNLLGNGNLSGIFSYLILAIISVSLFFLINWTFVFFVSIISSPFNDIISERVERNIRGLINETITVAVKKNFSGLGSILLNESKKLAFIIGVTIFAFFLGLIPVLAPISFILTAIMFSVQFVDYSWSRYHLSFINCTKDIKNNFILYFISGTVFLVLMSIPIINLISFPFAVIYFSVTHYKIKEKKLSERVL